MVNYYNREFYRAKVQLALCITQAVLAVLAILFMFLFVSTPVPSDANYGAGAIVTSIVWGAFYVAQVIFATATYIKTHNKTKRDVAFVGGSVAFLPAAVLVYCFLLLFL